MKTLYWECTSCSRPTTRRSIAIPNQGLLINSISLQEAKASNAIENIFTTDDELYKAHSEQQTIQLDGLAKEILNYSEALWLGYQYLQGKQLFDHNYFITMYRTVSQFGDGIRSPIAQTYIKEGGTGPKVAILWIIKTNITHRFPVLHKKQTGKTGNCLC